MNDATRHDTATIDATQTTETQAQLRDRLGVNPRTMQRRWRDIFGVSFASGSVATSEQVATMEEIFSGKTARVVSYKSAKNETIITVKGDINQEELPAKPIPNPWFLRIPLASATIASVANMWLICLHLSDGDKFSAGVMTAVFSGSALCFIAARAVSFWPSLVMWVLIGFEAFTNTTGVYYGLLGRTGTPTRFLGMVTDILNTGTHYTAIGLGATMAIIIGAVQIVSIKTIIQNIK